MSWRGRIRNLIKGGVWLDEPLNKRTSFQIGGPVDAWVCPENLDELKVMMRFVNFEGLPWIVLGDGSNVIVTDSGYKGVVIRLGGGFESVGLKGESLIVGSGMRVSKLLSFSAKKSLSSIEFLAGLPGTLGGALITNAGSSEADISSVVKRVLILKSSGRVASLSREDCGFRYRGSSFPDNAVIFEVELAAKKSETGLIREVINKVTEHRLKTQPLGFPSAGCIFKNPLNTSAGELIERCSLKGCRRGGAEVSCVHANFIVNRGGASADDVFKLIEDVRNKVYKKTGIELELEVEIIGSQE